MWTYFLWKDAILRKIHCAILRKKQIQKKALTNIFSTHTKGYVKAPKKDLRIQINDNCYLGQNVGAAICIYPFDDMFLTAVNDSCGIISDGIRRHKLPNNKTFKEGDRIGFYINHKKHICDWFHNGINMGTLFENVPLNIIPAASNSNSQTAEFSLYAVKQFIDNQTFQTLRNQILIPTIKHKKST